MSLSHCRPGIISAEERRVLFLRIEVGLDDDEIAERAHLSAGQVRALTLSGLTRLHSAEAPHYEE